MKISIITLFPEIIKPVLDTSILGRAQKKGLVEFELINLRDFGDGPHKVVDDRPYGGGPGMILKPDILAKALNSIINPTKFKISNLKFSMKITHPSFGGKKFKLKIILMSASGEKYNQSKARKLSKLDHIIIICGHYEGVDQRFIDKYVTQEISIGDYVLTGGEIPAMVLVDSITRLIPGVLEKPEATINESFTENLLEGPQYTRPEEFEGSKVPEILLSGNHVKIAKWRKEQSIKKTEKVRPDLLRS